MNLLAEERRFRIREILSRQRTVMASELIRMLGVTAATVRRDLAVLQKEGVFPEPRAPAFSRRTTRWAASIEPRNKQSPGKRSG
jgi:DeoR/GlpR family transcriptional regulator of sugar metabolism